MSESISVELGGFYEYSSSRRHGKALRGTGRIKGWRSLDIEADDGERYPISSMDVWVRENSEGKSSGLFVSTTKGEEYVQLNCYVDAGVFDELKDPPAKSITIDFELANDPRSKLQAEFGYLVVNKLSTEILALDFNIQEHRKIGRENSVSAVSKEILARYAAAEGSQIYIVADELLRNYEEQALQDPELRSKPERYLNLIEKIVDSLREAVQRSPQEQLVLSGNINSFRDYTKTLDQSAAARLSRAYDTVWTHQNSASLISAGNLDSDKIGELRADSLEEAARAYIGGKLVSPSLEQLLIDALLFAETIAFARAVPYIPTTNLKALIGKGSLKAIGLLLSEAIALFLTAIVAGVADGKQGVVFWVVFSAITAVRWLRPNDKRLAEQRLGQLMAEMSSAQGRLGKNHFNPRLLRELLYDLEKKGAVFSPFVHSLLDKRIAREGAASL